MTRAEESQPVPIAQAEELLAIPYAEALGDGRTISISPQVEALLGYTQEEWMRDPLLWVELMHPEDRDRVVAACEAANRSGEPFRADYRLIARDGRVIRIRDEAFLVRGADGSALCWQGVMFDVTPRPGSGSGRRAPT